jgi:hypothetical protein
MPKADIDAPIDVKVFLTSKDESLQALQGSGSFCE